MDIPNLLFNPNGRIDPKTFGRGAILLMGVWMVFLIVIAFGPRLLAAILSLLSMASAYCYLCVYGKRLHDANITAWGFILFLAAFLFVFTIIGGTLISLFAPNGAELLLQWDTLQRRGDIEAATELQPAVIRAIIAPMLVSFLAANAFLAYIAARLRSDPNSNSYGPPTQPSGMS